MKRDQTDAEALFQELANLAASRGYLLDEVRLTAQPRLERPQDPRGPFQEVRLRSRNYLDRLPDPKALEAYIT